MGKKQKKNAVSGKDGPTQVGDKYSKLDKTTLALIAKDTAMAKAIMKVRGSVLYMQPRMNQMRCEALQFTMH